MDYFIEVVEGPDSGLKVLIDGIDFTIGRDASHSKMVLVDSKVSRVHARISILSGAVYIEDLGSTHGTYLNGNLVESKQAFGSGDEILLGNTTMVLSVGFDQHTIPSQQLPEALITIGREASNDLVLTDTRASRSHARLESKGNTYYLTDLNSVDGTYLDGSKVTGNVEIMPPAWITICGINYYFDGNGLKTEQGVELASFGMFSVIGSSPSDKLIIPFQDGGLLKLILGALLTVIPLIDFFADGYLYRVFQQSTSGKTLLPEWGEWRELLTRGFLFFLVRLIYLLPLALFMIISILFVNQQPVFNQNLFILLLFFAFIIMAVTLFILPMGWAGFASTGNFKVAFDFSQIISRIQAVFRQYLIASALLLALWVIIGALALIPVLGVIVLIFARFYLKVFQALLFGELYRLSG